MEKILFLGNIQYGEEPTGGGVQTRNQLMLEWLKQRYDVRFYDTWEKPAIQSLLASLFYTIICANRLVIISYGGRGALSLIKILKFLHIKRIIKFYVPGGDLLGIVKNKDIKYWSYFADIFVQSKQMLKKLNEKELNNITYCPNFKYINYRPKHIQYQTGNLMKFVYVGRLIEKKGIQVMIDACKLIKENFVLTIYGKETQKYSKDYFMQLNDNRIIFKGYINLKSNEGYDELASHDILIFPTFFDGEGFSGTLIDAFICGLPIIATDFNVNSEIVEDGVTGIIISPNNSEELAVVMSRMIKGEVDIKKMSKASSEIASAYNIDTIMSKICEK